VSEPLLTAAMIVRDEEEHLPGCLESIRELVDEIVIVDTGSTDDTVEIARRFGARVHERPWDDDFATPRNLGLDLARGRWILYIDADERVRPIDFAAFRRRLEAADEFVLRVRLKLSSTVTPAWEYRLWRSDPRIRFRGSMHEKVTPAIAEVAHSDRGRISESELFLDHLGYDGDQLHKHRRNLPLLRAELAADPDNSYNWNYLVIALSGLDLHEESDQALERGLALTEEQRSTAGALLRLERIRRAWVRDEDVDSALDEAVRDYPDNFGLAWLKVIREIRTGAYRSALTRLERFDADPEMPVEEALGYPRELFEARAIEAQAICLFRLSQYHEAAAAWRKLEQLEPDEPQHRLKRVIAEHRAVADTSSRGSDSGEATSRRWRARRVPSGLTIDVGGVAMLLTASDLTRALAMRALLGHLRVTEAEPLVSMHFGAHPAPPPERPPDGEHGGMSVWHVPDLFLAARGVTGHVRAGRAAIGGLYNDLGLLFRVAGPPLLGRLLAPHGVFLVHAGAVERDGRVLLILGGSGAGKSTAVVGAWREGWSVLSDDLVFIRLGPSGPVAHGLPKRLAVPPEAAPPAEGSPTVGPGNRGRIDLTVDGWVDGWWPISQVALADHGDSPDTRTEPVDTPGLLGALSGSLLSRHPDDVRAFVPVAMRLCAAPGFRLCHGLAPDQRLAGVAAALQAGVRDRSR